ncbi:hypothetical protein K9L67_00785 [Candidatus Woesearchaeota archaeon]|nr:hypothetical protein [Candidatus Woesearchaeota archaeon]MCF7900742.1 hypothetical protein [Candidatus Woesearchaeota archaeon]MCF8012907.1 hypothetical protein [Candidatus Woesearchaeota archaeon]
MNKKILILLFTIMLIIISTNILAIGIVPAQKEILIDKNSYSFPLKIINNEQKEFLVQLNAEGKYSEFVSFSKKTIQFSPDKDFEEITVNINMPSIQNLDFGENKITISANQKTNLNSQISTNIGVLMDLILIKPYETGELKIEFFTSNFIKNNQGNFVLEATNVGLKEVTETKSTIEIFDISNNKLEEKSKSEKIIKKGETKIFNFPWTPNLENGIYIAKATIIYDNKIKNITKKFNIGSPELIIDFIKTYNYKLGDVAQLDLIIVNQWSQPIKNAHAEIFFRKNSKTIANINTSSETIEAFSKKTFPIYWDTKNQEIGTYQMIVDLYFEGRKTTNTYEININENSFEVISKDKKLTEQKYSEKTSLEVYLFVIIMVIFILILIFILLKNLNKHKKK